MDSKIKFSMLIALSAALAAVPVKAYFFKPEKISSEKLPDEKVDLDRFRKNLSDAIKIPTIASKEPENTDWSNFEKFYEFLQERYPLIHSKLQIIDVGKGPLLYKWQGSDPTLDPIALLSHQDVVPISEGTYEDWTYPPFEGVDDGEFIWGRGALDMKNHLIAVMESVEDLLEEGFQPIRDIYICLGHNEEVMSSKDSGAIVMCKYFAENGIHLDCVLDEGGAILPVNVKGVINKNLAGIGIAEKGYADFEVSVTAKGGHSSQSPNHTALGYLADVIKDIENNQFKAELSPMMMKLFDKIGRNCSYPVRLVTCNIKLLKPLLTKVMTYIPPAASLIRTTQGVTMASGSPAPNVLPQKASINVNVRIYPGETVEDAKNHLRKVIKNKKAEITVKPGWKNPSKLSPTDSRCFKAIEDICMRTDSNNIVAPYLVMGGTDACHYEDVCENIYRYSPFLVNTGLLLTTHGTNERIPISSMSDGIQFFKRYIRKLSDK
ncbi:MAG: M20/M25/M40 family metallo-hydrolase [Clostridia bacterium]|nr:M20/M25/M40 family metallo-hydrolase [Clostridia bacterium]